MDEARDQGSAGNDSVPPRVFGAAWMAGGLLASLVAVAARYETGFPPGVTPPPFARLIGQPAPAFSLGGLQGGTVSPVDAPAGGAWLLIDPQGIVRQGAVGTGPGAGSRLRGEAGLSMAAHRPSLVIGGLLALALTGALTAVDGPPGSLLNRLPRSQWQQLPRGTPAPDFQLAGIAGPGLELADLKGRSSAVVFVTTTCQYCNDLKANLLDAGLPDLGGRLVFIHGPDDGPSAEPPDDSVEARIRDLYPVLLDTTGETSLAYYAVSVPTAYRIDPKGTVAAAARGAGPVLELVEELAQDLGLDEGCRSCP